MVRHRLAVFNERLKKLQFGDSKEGLPGFGRPEAIVLEFVREDFMGEEAKRRLQAFQKERERERAEARAVTAEIGATTGLSALKYQLWKAQGGECLYGKEVYDERGESKARCVYRNTALPLSRLDEYVIDHIVPRARGGPDAMINYVLTTRETNDEKGDRTPFEWLHGTPYWDAYVQRVKARAASLGAKKVRLLTREDAPELVERYTAMAETAWISKLAQTIVNLRFGWKGGVDKTCAEPTKRVRVVSGGLTAQIRRKYGLDKLLYGESTPRDVVAKKVKNREDDRHHALDAMVMTFIPQWARDPNKEGFFRFPAEFRNEKGHEDRTRIRAFFAAHIAKVIPRNLAYEPAELADTIYGKRHDPDRDVIVQRVEVRELAYRTVQQRRVFDLEYAAKQVAAVRDRPLRHVLESFVATKPDQAAWDAFCAQLAAGLCAELPGRKVLKVTVNRDEDPEEFADLSKDGTGAFRTRKGEHQGQFVYVDAAGKLHVRPVRVFESFARVKAEVAEKAAGGRLVGFFQSMCLVELEREVRHGPTVLSPGVYRLNTIKQAGRARLTSASGQKSPEINLRKLLAAGFRRKA